MKYYLIAGEASGDLHASYLMRAIKEQDATAEFRCWGGDLMAAAGGDVRKHYKELAFMGFAEVLKNIKTILRNFKTCKADVLDYQPDALILVDYPGFNLRIAKWARQQGLRIFYYISPQIWAWHTSRVHQIKANVDRMFVILPFELDFYRKYQANATFVGHPLLDVVQELNHETDFRAKHRLGQAPIIALLPGSRRQEIERILPEMLAASSQFSGYQFVVAAAPSQDLAFYQSVIENAMPEPLFSTTVEQRGSGVVEKTGIPLSVVEGATYQLLLHADAALVASGTATLETALLGTPQVVCYKGSSLSYRIAKRLVQVKYISLVNLVMDAPLVQELIQDDCTPEKIAAALEAILQPDERDRLKAGYRELRQKLGSGGAAQRTAEAIVDDLVSSRGHAL